MDNICGDTIHFSHDVTSCSRKVAAYWSAGRARFDKRMSAAAVRDEARRHETMAECGRAPPAWPARGGRAPIAWVRLARGSSAYLDWDWVFRGPDRTPSSGPGRLHVPMIDFHTKSTREKIFKHAADILQFLFSFFFFFQSKISVKSV